MNTSTTKVNKSEIWGQRLKTWRVKHGFTQQAAAQKLGIGRSYYSQLENGRPSSGITLEKFKLLEAQPVHPESNANVYADDEIVPLRLIPLVSWAQAGHAVDYDELPVDWQKRVHTDVTDPKAFAVRIAGDSMEPRYHQDDVAFLEPSRPVRQHDTVIARLQDQGVVFKIYSRTGDTVRFSSYNPAYPPFEVRARVIVWAYPVHSVLTVVNK